MENNYLESVRKQFADYKLLGEKTISQLSEEELNWQYNKESNSIASIVHHLWGNMLSRWTDFLTTDGEKEWRERDAEFEHHSTSRELLMERWNAGWACLLNTLNELTTADLSKEIFIRKESHTVVEAINRQLAHYPSHIGQIMFIGKMLRGEKWQSLSIPKGKSNEYNAEKFSKPNHQ